MKLKKFIDQQNRLETIQCMYQQDLDYKTREKNIADHHQKIKDRDDKIFSIYSQPNQITFSKQEYLKNVHANVLNDALLKKETEKTKKTIDERERRRNSL